MGGGTSPMMLVAKSPSGAYLAGWTDGAATRYYPGLEAPQLSAVPPDAGAGAPSRRCSGMADRMDEQKAVGGSEDPVQAFHRRFYSSDSWKQTYWLGVQVLKNPLDLWVYQEILHRTRPDTIIETCTYEGGSALYLASVCDFLGHGQVVSIDVAARARPEHPRITYVEGDSTEPQSVARANLAGARWSCWIPIATQTTCSLSYAPTRPSCPRTAT